MDISEKDGKSVSTSGNSIDISNYCKYEWIFFWAIADEFYTRTDLKNRKGGGGDMDVLKTKEIKLRGV